MKTFMSAALQETEPKQNKPVKGATECNSCNGGAVHTAGQESVEAAAPEAEKAPGPVVVMQGPLGTAITEALNKSLAKKTLQSPVQVPGIGTESFAINHVQANGQIADVGGFVSKITKSVGLVPATDSEPTTINTLIDCASKVDDIEFIMVNTVESAPSDSQVPQKSHINLFGPGVTPGMEEIAIESVHVVVKYRKR